MSTPGPPAAGAAREPILALSAVSDAEVRGEPGAAFSDLADPGRYCCCRLSARVPRVLRKMLAVADMDDAEGVAALLGDPELMLAIEGVMDCG